MVELGMVVAIAKEVLVTTDAVTGDFAAKFIVADHHYLLDWNSIELVWNFERYVVKLFPMDDAANDFRQVVEYAKSCH